MFEFDIFFHLSLENQKSSEQKKMTTGQTMASQDDHVKLNTLQKPRKKGSRGIGPDGKLNLYAALDVKSSATSDEIKKAFKKLALVYHPDKLSKDLSLEQIQDSVEEFKLISTYYSILIDPAKRRRYDLTGSIDDLDTACGFTDKSDDLTWDEYFRTLFDTLTEEKIDEFEKQYRYSEDERKDVLEAYLQTRGSLLAMIDIVPLSNVDDISRFQTLVESAISAGEVPKYAGFPKVKQADLNRKRRELAREAREAEAIAAESRKRKGDDDLAELAVTLQQNRQNRMEALTDSLEVKYLLNEQNQKKAKRSVNKKKQKSVTELHELDDEEFRKVQQQILGERKSEPSASTSNEDAETDDKAVRSTRRRAARKTSSWRGLI